MSAHSSALLALAVLAGLTSPAPAQADTAAARPAVTHAVVIDATGRQLGSLSGPGKIYVDMPDGGAVVEVEANGLVANPADYPISYYPVFPNVFLYETANCTGQPYSNEDSLQTPPLGAFEALVTSAAPGYSRPGKIFYRERATSTKHIRSTLRRRSPGRFCDAIDQPNLTVNAIKTRDIPSFKLPLAIAVRPY
jgi:hypothetical protein